MSNYDPSPLFEPLTVKSHTIPNRIVMPPMVVNRGHTDDTALEWYGSRARGGAGLVIVEATGTERFCGKQTPTGGPLTAENLRPLVDAIHDGGALAAIQLFPFRRKLQTAPADLSLEEIRGLVDQYRTAAKVCGAAGFDGVEPHGAHGFLLNQFFSPEKNLRTDGYGGSKKNRMRLGLEVVRAVRPVADDTGMLLLYRHTPVGPGYGIEESVPFARKLVEAGVDILDLSPSSHEAPADLAAPFTGLGVPCIAVNELDRVERALEVLSEKRASLVAIGRALIADPEWPIKIRDGRTDEIVTCTYCDHCFVDLREDRPVGCVQW